MFLLKCPVSKFSRIVLSDDIFGGLLCYPTVFAMLIAVSSFGQYEI